MGSGALGQYINTLQKIALSPNAKLLILLSETISSKGSVVPELHQHGIVQYRESILATCRIIYRINGSMVYITVVFDSRRNLEDLLLVRLSRV